MYTINIMVDDNVANNYTLWEWINFHNGVIEWTYLKAIGSSLQNFEWKGGVMFVYF